MRHPRLPSVAAECGGAGACSRHFDYAAHYKWMKNANEPDAEVEATGERQLHALRLRTCAQAMVKCSGGWRVKNGARRQ